ncbi:hypothetical protein AWH62_13895 [Maricaulis sp. W15]|uniref:SpoIIAA-like protein n=1 Tax=Maricaulis maris TaxID=74318 RepID=A0A495DDL2_9PROT|nr:MULTISPECIES: hypothetical protein [Maricaulis]OLF80810.1 hypothetical protein AWH62_13895 [Maricaulis sp. W15]RKR00392.1 hypothetical protein C7435_1600 [Maricaulis maris]
MVQAYSMEGFEIRIDGSVLEMRTEGTRTVGMGRDSGRSFESFLAHSDVSGVLFDVRGAHYDFTPDAWEERARVIARICTPYPTAFVGRPDQDGQIGRVMELLEARGGSALHCRSRQSARVWLDGHRTDPARKE